MLRVFALFVPFSERVVQSCHLGLSPQENLRMCGKGTFPARFWIVSDKRTSLELPNTFYSFRKATIGSTRDAGREIFSAEHWVRALTCRWRTP